VRPKGVTDGQQVNIPVPPNDRYTMGRRRRIGDSGDGCPDGPAKAGSRRKIREVIQR
jgi:hypothetical protein